MRVDGRVAKFSSQNCLGEIKARRLYGCATVIQLGIAAILFLLAINPRVHLIAGGFHLVTADDSDVDRIATALHDQFKVEYIAPGHCTGEPAFTAFRKAFGDRYLYAGLGTTLFLSKLFSQTLILDRYWFVRNSKLILGPCG